jgi:hypothetical protein
MANVFALSNETSFIGGGFANSGFEVEIKVLKYWKIYSTVILNGKFEQIIFNGWFSAIEYLYFYY